VITTIGFDHEKFLGNTLEQIAYEKAGIIKSGVPVVTGEKKSDILKLLKTVAEKQSAKLHVVSQELEVTFFKETLESQDFQIGRIVHTISLLGRHQIDNAATAFLTIEVLRQQGWDVSDEDIKKGLTQTRWPGRMQIVSREPLIVVDGAHNPDGVAALHAFIKGWNRYDVLVLAQKQGKKFDDMYTLIVPLFRHIIVTEGTFEPMAASELASLLQGYVKGNVLVVPNSHEALRQARELLPPDGTMLVTGSLYMIGAAL
jgi:dihydrofolate synthase / folylpolyglutamate synthase